MRKLLIILTLILIFSVSNAFGAGSQFLVTGDSVIYSHALNRPIARLITAAFTADNGTGAIPNLTITGTAWSDGTNTGTLRHSINGWLGYKVIIDANHGGTEPSEDSELYIYENSFDLLAGGGVDQVDNTIERQVFFNNGTYNVKQPLTAAVTITVTQQAVAVNSATGTIYIYLVSD